MKLKTKRGKHTQQFQLSSRSIRLRKALAWTLSFMLVFSTMPVGVASGVGVTLPGICGHIHDEYCGYAEDAPCLHEHDENCGGLFEPEAEEPADGKPRREVPGIDSGITSNKQGAVPLTGNKSSLAGTILQV